VRKWEKKIQEADKAIVDYRTHKFGTSGELYTKTNELMKPIQDKIFKAIKDIADEGGYDYVFDKSSTTLLMFANEKYDLSARVLAKTSDEMTVKQIAAFLDGEVVGDGSIVITGLAKVEEAGTGDLAFVANPKYERYLELTKASAVILGAAIAYEKFSSLPPRSFGCRIPIPPSSSLWNG